MSILILYGSETGTAQDIAESMRRESQMRHLTARVLAMDEYLPEFQNLPTESVVLFIVSTTGQGEMPPNMRKMWKLMLRKSLGNDYLKKVYTSVLALGDSSYQKYNFAGKKLNRRLIQLGAIPLTESIFLADDQHEVGVDAAFIPWKRAVFQKLFSISGEMDFLDDMTENVDPNVKIETKFRFLQNSENQKFGKRPDDDYFGFRISKNSRVTSEDHWQDTRLIRFEFTENEKEQILSYRPGDVMMVRPYNPEESIKIAIEALGYSDELLDRTVKIERNDRFSKLPPEYLIGNPTTLRTCLQRYFDLQQIPKRSFFEMLSYYSKNASEKERLTELSSPEGLDDLLDYANRSRRTTAEALRDFPATAKSLEPDHLFEILPVIRPRAFSIASPPNSKYVELLVAKVEYKSRMKDPRRGLCSTFLSRLEIGDEVFCKIRVGTFKFPYPEDSIICVGPGTGVAPFRSLFGQRSHIARHAEGLLFFGCRGKNKDFYFSDEWNETIGVEVITAFSRDTDKKVYVQHKMAERATEIKRMLDAGASLFIAGSAGDMPKAVAEIIQKIKGPEWTKKAEEVGRIQYETWS